MIKASELMLGNLVMTNSGPAKVTKLKDGFIYFEDRLGGGITFGVDGIPLSNEILAEICSYEEHLPSTGATEEVTYYIIDRLKIKHNTEDWRHEYFCVEGIPYELKWLHQFQQLFTIFGIEKEIALDGISVKGG